MKFKIPCITLSKRNSTSTSPPARLASNGANGAMSSGNKKGFKGKFKRGLHWFKDDSVIQNQTTQTAKEKEKQPQNRRRSTADEAIRHDDSLHQTPSIEAGPPKPIERQDSERRDNLQENRPTRAETRAMSVDRRRLSRASAQGLDFRSTNMSLASPRHTSLSFDPRGTATSLRSPRATVTSIHDPRATNASLASKGRRRESTIDEHQLMMPEQPPMSPRTDLHSAIDDNRFFDEMDIIEEELEWRWILNLSMHFRERSDREKFFVTYAQTPHVRYRITVSCDYRNAEPGSLEDDLKHIKFQREKSARIYEAVRESLLDIQFYDTITNLKLETEGGRLHVHVVEDENEIIPYPTVAAIDHLDCLLFRESDLDFECHLSGFVYQVRCNDLVFVKKEIPGPDTVEEFLYEINALWSLRDSKSVIQFGGLVVDDQQRFVKGLLIGYASRGSLVDLVYNERGRIEWKRRERWSRQIVQGLSEIHEAGYVQGDFTMANMVIDENDDIRIIDINRRGCPIGWEPPEINVLIDSQQRIGMFIGVKSDLFQLGMVLWALVHQVDEPEAAAKPLNMNDAPGYIPDYFRDIVTACLSSNPKHRPSATDLLKRFPPPERRDTLPPVDIVVDGQVIHVSPASADNSPTKTRTSPTSLRLKSALPILPDQNSFVQSPMAMSAITPTEMTYTNGVNKGGNSHFPYSKDNHPFNHVRRQSKDATCLDRERLMPSRHEPEIPPDSPASNIVNSPPIDEAKTMDWQLSAPPQFDRMNSAVSGAYRTPAEEFPPDRRG